MEDGSTTSYSHSDDTVKIPHTQQLELQRAEVVEDFQQDKEDKILNDLDPRYFTQYFDPVEYVLESLPINPFALTEHLLSEIGTMDVAKDVVTSKLAEDIQRNYTSFIQGMNQVQEVDLDLALALIQVKNGRRLLASHKQDLVMSHLELVKLRRNRDRLQSIIDHATNIMNCFKKEQEMFGLLQDKEFELAVQLCVDMKARYSHLRQFYVLRPILQRMTQALPELRKQFNMALCDLLTSFDSELYGRLLKAYAALDLELETSKSLVDGIPEVLVRGIDDFTREVVAGVDSLMKSPPVSISLLMDTIYTCYEQLTMLLHGYYLFLQWHRDPYSTQNAQMSYLHRSGIDADATEKDELRQTFQRYRKLIWDNMQQRLIDMWSRVSWSNDVKMEHIVGLSQATLQFIAVGDEFSGSKSAKLRSAWQTKCRRYLTHMQTDSIELMRMMLDTEKWERLSIALDKSRSILVLLEKRCGYSLRHTPTTTESTRYEHLPSFHLSGNPFNSSHRQNYLQVPGMDRFSLEIQKEDEEQKIIERMIELDPYLREHDPLHQSPLTTPEQDEIIRYGSKYVITSSAFSGFLRFCGIYIKLMQQIPLLRDDLWMLLLDLFDFVFYSIFITFCPENYLQRLVARQTPSDLPCDNLRIWVLKLQEEYPRNPIQSIASDSFLDRIVAMESVVFLAHVLVEAARELDTSLDALLLTVNEARSFIFACTAPQAIQAATIPSLVEKASWDTGDISERHNEYIVTIVRNCGMFWGTLQGSTVPYHVRMELWQFAIRAIMEALVDGYASLKQCTMEGRALMSMDLIALQNGLDLINHVSQQSQNNWDRSYVNNYIKAYYFQEPELLVFIASNKNKYRKSHLIALALNGVCSRLKKPAQKDLMQKIDQIFRSDTRA